MFKLIISFGLMIALLTGLDYFIIVLLIPLACNASTAISEPDVTALIMIGQHAVTSCAVPFTLS